jgi:hypothetical protein
MRPNSVPEGNLLISLDTTRAVSAEQGLAFMHALLFELRQMPDIGPRAHIEIVNLSRGSIWAQVAIIVGTVVLGAGAIGAAVEAIKTELEQGNGDLAKETARTLIAYDGRNCTILTKDAEVVINIQDIPARSVVSDEPTAAPEGFDHVRRRGVYVRNDGEFAVAPKKRGRPAQRPVARGSGVYTNIPAGEAVERPGQLALVGQELRFIQPDGSYGRVDAIRSSEQPPHGVPLIAEVSATRGDQGGFADRGVQIHRWKLVEPEPSAPSPPAQSGGSALPDDPGNAQRVSLVGELDNSFGEHPFEFVSKKGDTYYAEEADDFSDMIILGREVFLEGTLVQTDMGPLIYIHALRMID